MGGAPRSWWATLLRRLQGVRPDIEREIGYSEIHQFHRIHNRSQEPQWRILFGRQRERRRLT